MRKMKRSKATRVINNTAGHHIITLFRTLSTNVGIGVGVGVGVDVAVGV